MENEHGNLSVDVPLILNEKVRRCFQCSCLSLGFQHMLFFCGKIGFPVVFVSKSDLVQLANDLFLRFFWIFLLCPIVSSIAVCVSTKDFISSSSMFIFRIQFLLHFL